MKYLFVILFSLMSVSSSFGQINIGKSRGISNLWVKEHKAATFEMIKERKTLFILPNMLNNVELQTTIKEIWTFNEITFIEDNDFELNKEDYYSSDYLVIRLLDREYTLKENGVVKDQPWKKTYFSAGTINNVRKNEEGDIDYDHTPIAEIYLKPSIVNLNPDGETYSIRVPMVKNYFQELNRLLVDSQNLAMLDGIEKKGKLKLLADKTLYIPWGPSPILKCDEPYSHYHLEFMAKEYIGHTGHSTAEAHLEFLSEIFESYDYKYEIITQEELDEKILKGDDFYYMNNTQYKYFNIMSIANGATGEIIYLDLKKATWSLKGSRIKGISKAVSKSI